MSKFKILFLSFLALAAVGCAHSIHQVHSSDMIPYAALAAGEVIRADSEQFVVLGFTGETNYVDQAYAQLLSRCPNSQITGLTTQFSTSLGFLSWTNKVVIQGICLKN